MFNNLFDTEDEEIETAEFDEELLDQLENTVND
jgi:hypothetical protein